MDPLAQQLAYVAALCGADFSATMAARLLERPPARLLVPWRRLEDMDILRGNQFSHDLVRQAVLAAVPRSLAPLLHRDIAQALAGAAPDRRAAHWELAERPAEAAADFSAAAFAAEAMGLQSSACELWRAAARNHRAAQCEDAAFRCEWRIGRLLLACASAAEAMQVARRLEQSARHAGERAMALELRSQIRSEQHDVGALDDAQAALALAVESGDGQLAALCRLRIASAWTVRNDYPAALDAIESVQRDAALLDADALVDLASLRVSVLAQLGRRAEAIAVNQHALDQALSSGSLAHAANFAGNAAIQLCYLGRLAEAAAGFERAVALGHRAGVERGFILVDEMGLAGVLADAGRLGEALALGERVAGELQHAGYDGWAVNAHNDCADIFLRLGRFDLAQHILGAEPASAPTWARAARRVALARLAQWRGRDPLPLVREAAELLHQGGALGHPYVKQKIELELARWTAAPQAAEQAARVIEWAAGHQHVSLGWYAGMVRIEALSMQGDTAAAARDAAALAAAFEGDWRAYGFYLPELWCVLCEAWAAAGAASPLQATLRYARRWIEERAARDVPELFRASFLEHNRFNRRLLDWPARAEITLR